MYQAQLSNPAPGTVLADATLQGLVNQLRPLLSVQPVPGSGDSPYSFQAAVPGAADRGKIWFRKSDETPTALVLGEYFYLNGKWCPIYKFRPGFLAMYYGDPTSNFDLTTGKGKFASDTPEIAGDYYGWQLLLDTVTGQDFPGRLLIAANRWDSGTSGFQAKLADGTYAHSGGDPTGTTLTPANIPSLTVGPALSGFEFNAANNNAALGVYVGNHQTTPEQSPTVGKTPNKFTNPNDGEVATPIPYKYPPFRAVAMMTFIGYGYTS